MSSINSYLHLSKNKDNVTDLKSDDLFLIQHFEYNCNRARNEIGMPYGYTQSAILSITIRDVTCINEIYKQIKAQETYDYYIFSEATFNDGNLVTNQCNTIKATGYIVDITENYIYSPHKKEKSVLASVTMQILVTSMSYRNRNGQGKTLVISG